MSGFYYIRDLIWYHEALLWCSTHSLLACPLGGDFTNISDTNWRQPILSIHSAINNYVHLLEKELNPNGSICQVIGEIRLNWSQLQLAIVIVPLAIFWNSQERKNRNPISNLVVTKTGTDWHCLQVDRWAGQTGLQVSTSSSAQPGTITRHVWLTVLTPSSCTMCKLSF